MKCKNCEGDFSIYPDEEHPLTDFDEKFCSEKCFQDCFNQNEIVRMVAGRLQKGYDKYNQIMPINDGRDWLEECLEEILDCCVYIGNMLIVLRQKRQEN